MRNFIKTVLKKIKFARSLWHLEQSIFYFVKHPFPKHNKRNREGVVVQLLTTFVDKDAVGNSAIEISKELDKKKNENYIVYEGAHSYIKNGVPVKNFRFNKKDIVIYHMCTGCNASKIYKKIVVKRKIMNYHNITPSKFFYDVPRVKKMLDLGRKQLIELKDCTDLAVCDSKYNESELKDIGYKNTCVVPIPTRINDLLKYKVKKEDDLIKNIITVGRIARNKCIEDVVRVFNEYHKITPNSHLYIIGRSDNINYFNEIKTLVNNLNLNDKVTFVGQLSEKELAEYYSNAHAYLCMSEHEGFCIPVFEAFAFGVKVIAKKNTALVESVGEYGILTDSKNYYDIALLIDNNARFKKYSLNNQSNIDWILNNL